MNIKFKTNMKSAVMMATLAAALAVGTLPTSAYAAGAAQMPGQQNGMMPDQQNGMMPGQQNGMMPNQQNGMQGYTLASSASEIVTTDLTCTASSLTADEANATTFTMSDNDGENQVKITESGTYIVTGSCSNGNITVKKGTTGVVLILRDLDLTSTTGATVSCNKESQVKLIISGTVNLTDAENAADETSTDSEVADAFDGAAIKVKDGANVNLTGDGTLNINGTAKNGIKIGNENNPCFVMDGSLTTNITAANDGINGGYDVTITSGNLNITAADDAIHADRILTIGNEGSGPDIKVSSSKEALEGTVVNLFGGNAMLNASDDGINAANSDGTYASLGYSINVTGGSYTVKCTGDGLDSNGNINITGGSVTINSGSQGGEAGMDYDGSLYISDSATVNNSSGIAGPDGMQGMMPGQQNGMMPGQQNGMMPGQQEAQSQDAAATNGSQADTTAESSQSQSSSEQKKTATAKASRSTIKKTTVNKRAQTVKITTTTDASSGKVKYTNASSSKLKKYITIKKNGKNASVTIKKGAPKGTYKIKVTTSATENYKATSKTISIKVK